jgi:hypothetical protein
MNSRHTAVLALVVWYFMTPPAMPEAIHDPLAVQLNAPLSKWKIRATFTTEADCEMREKNYRTKRAPRELDEITTKDFEMWHARCVASDDPHLKDK